MTVEVRPAARADVTAVIDLLGEASAWLASKGVEQWEERFSDEFVAGTVDRGELFVAVDGGLVVGTLTLMWSDPVFWGDRTDAGFVHRLAVSRTHAGLGRRLVDWADRQVELQGRGYLCLDTGSELRRLHEYYRTLGFRAVGRTGGRFADGRPWHATLFERAVAVHRGDDGFESPPARTAYS